MLFEYLLCVEYAENTEKDKRISELKDTISGEYTHKGVHLLYNLV